jgi:hypothetical protein
LFGDLFCNFLPSFLWFALLFCCFSVSVSQFPGGCFSIIIEIKISESCTCLWIFFLLSFGSFFSCSARLLELMIAFDSCSHSTL